MIDFDGAWKYVIERMLRWILETLAPELAAEIDWRVAPTFLDTELAKLKGGKRRGLRRLDKLVKLQLLNGHIRLMLIHIEVQNKPDPSFPYRMFSIFYRLLDQYGHDYEVTSLAVLSDLQASWRPGPYCHRGLGINLVFEYPTVKLLDLEPRLETLIAQGNPFALIVALHLKLMRERPRGDACIDWKCTAFKEALLASKHFGQIDQATILQFIDWVVTLPPELDNQVKERLNETMKEAGMEFTGGIHGNIRVLALAEGRGEGRKESALTIVENLMRKRFGPLSQSVLDALQVADTDQLISWSNRLFDYDTPEALLVSTEYTAG